jgi:peptidoglycan hydrolase-like protein with peptidoglycan-binding domain
MKKIFAILICLQGVCCAFDAQGLAQTKPPAIYQVTYKEVLAAQDGLYRRGYLKTPPNGTLDQETLRAIQRYQADNRLKETGKLDFETYSHLGLVYPATGRIVERRTAQPAVQTEAKPAVNPPAPAESKTSVKPPPVKLPVRAVETASVKKTETKPRVETVDTAETRTPGPDVASLTKGAARGLGRATARGSRGLARSAKNTTGRAGNALFSRSDDDLRFEVGREIDDYLPTRGWPYAVKGGNVTLRAPSKESPETGQIVANIRKIAGVKSVVVITK